FYAFHISELIIDMNSTTLLFEVITSIKYNKLLLSFISSLHHSTKKQDKELYPVIFFYLHMLPQYKISFKVKELFFL
ncbi:hypothetical protein QVL63_01060, partial [Bartonella henselae]|uniref:hypothetical protein n=1 Tax=Bartonella henselae TaxID=38323 RepID=UPI0025AA5BA2